MWIYLAVPADITRAVAGTIAIAEKVAVPETKAVAATIAVATIVALSATIAVATIAIATIAVATIAALPATISVATIAVATIAITATIAVATIAVAPSDARSRGAGFKSRAGHLVLGSDLTEPALSKWRYAGAEHFAHRVVTSNFFFCG